MGKYLQKCKECKKYSLPTKESKCKHCGGELATPNPPKYSPIDKYGKYRMTYFKERFEEKYGKN